MKKKILIRLVHFLIFFCLGGLGYAQESLPKDIIRTLDLFEKKVDTPNEKSDLNDIKENLQKLKDIQKILEDCEKNSQKELDGISHITNLQENGVSNEKSETNAIQNKEIKADENKFQNNLYACKYYLIKLYKIKDKYISQLSTMRITNYWQKALVYQSALEESQWNVLDVVYYYGFLILYFLTLSGIIQFSVRKELGKKEANYQPLTALILIGFTSLIPFAINYFFPFFSYDYAWIFFNSILLIPRHSEKKNSVTIKLLFVISIIIGVTNSLLINSELIWQGNKYWHGVIAFSAMFSVMILFYLREPRTLKKILMLLTLLTMTLEASEYHALAHQILMVLYILLILQSFHEVVLMILDSAMSILRRSKTEPIKKIRKNISLTVTNDIPGLTWFKWSLYASIVIAVFMVLIGYTGLPENIIILIEQTFIEGFTFGSVTLNPRNLLFAMFILSTLLIFSWAIRQKIENNFKKKDTDASDRQNAKGSLFWYSAVSFSSLVALSISGFNLGNIAIIAGAFSVGIGFGLQNIVSNFISGIILLIERPVKPNDWVEIGGTQGFVEKINIRSTHIKTFDNSDVLIPNSEFISNHVTNFMFEDSVGRVKIKIGVAYGSDTKLVAKLLKQILATNKNVVIGDENFPYSVLFMEFGDSSLNFQLRFFIREISQILNVTSEINFAIDDVFREHQIEIPFPQRVIHLKNNQE